MLQGGNVTRNIFSVCSVLLSFFLICVNSVPNLLSAADSRDPTFGTTEELGSQRSQRWDKWDKFSFLLMLALASWAKLLFYLVRHVWAKLLRWYFKKMSHIYHTLNHFSEHRQSSTTTGTHDFLIIFQWFQVANL